MESCMAVLLVTDFSRKSLTYCKRVNFLGNWKVLNLGGKFGRNKKSLSHDVQVYCWLFQVKANTYRPLGSTRMLDYRSTTVNHFVSGGIWGKRNLGQKGVSVCNNWEMGNNFLFNSSQALDKEPSLPIRCPGWQICMLQGLVQEWLAPRPLGLYYWCEVLYGWPQALMDIVAIKEEV